MGRLLVEQFRSLVVPLTDGFVRGLLADPPVLPTEVVSNAPVPEVLDHGLGSGIGVLFSRGLLGQPVHPLG